MVQSATVSKSYRFDGLLRGGDVLDFRALLAPLLLRLRGVRGVRGVAGRIPASIASIPCSSRRRSCKIVSIKAISATTAARYSCKATECSSVRVAHSFSLWSAIVVACAAGSTAWSSGPFAALLLTVSARVNPPLFGSAWWDIKPPGEVAVTPAVMSRYDIAMCGAGAPPPAAPPPALAFFRRGDFRLPGDTAFRRDGDFRPLRGGDRHGRLSARVLLPGVSFFLFWAGLRCPAVCLPV